MPSPSFYLSILSALSSTAFATQYTLKDSYAGNTFLDGFTFFSDADPTNGFVKYLDKTSAGNNQLFKMVGTDNYLGVDYTTPLTVAAGVGRASVRIESTKTYNKGLFILDVKHMPGGICGTWPAFWSLGSGTWPQSGEIDIIEGVNTNTQNKMVLHTDTQCKTNGIGQSGAQNLYDCALDSASGASGCDVNTIESNTFGAGFNANGGGVYAMEWTSTSIKVWFFPRNSIPASITAGAPDTTAFGIPQANFGGACDIDTRFKNHKFIFDTTFCGDWAGAVYGQSSCPKYSGLTDMDSCKKFVAENPSAFRNAYWQIASFKTYNALAVVSSSTSTPVSTSTPISSSTRISTSTSVSTSSLVTSTRSSTPVSTSTLVTSTRTSTPVSTSTPVTSTRTSSAATPTATKKVSTDATCGGTGGFTCQSSTFGNCCSSNGWCGSTTAYCGTGCNASFGTCSGTVVSSSAIVASSSRASSIVAVSSTRTSTSAAATATKKVTTDATCGGTNAFTCQGSGFGNCCSSSGWCGSTAAYCATGCQKAFGTCT